MMSMKEEFLKNDLLQVKADLAAVRQELVLEQQLVSGAAVKALQAEIACVN